MSLAEFFPVTLMLFSTMQKSPSTQNIHDSDAFMSVSDQYLRLASASAIQILSRGNNSVAWDDGDGRAEPYDDQTYYCDQNIGVAVIFNLFHGIELFLKALLMRVGKPEKGHAISVLIEKCQAAFPNSDLAKFLVPYYPVDGHSSSIKTFFDDNQLGPDAWYEALKYPETNGGVKVSHLPIKFPAEPDGELWRTIAGAFPSFQIAAKKATQDP